MGATFSKSGTGSAVSSSPRASFHLEWEWRTTPRIIMSNKSPYRVSYWVRQEDKKRTRAHKRRTFSHWGLHVRAGLGFGGASADIGRNADVAVETEEVAEYLMMDHRMEPMGLTQDTEVPFPVGCQELRVYAYYEEDGQWHLYKDKVYSTGPRPRTGGVLLTALSSNIAPYRKVRGKSADLGQPSGGCSKCSCGRVKTLFDDTFRPRTETLSSKTL